MEPKKSSSKGNEDDFDEMVRQLQQKIDDEERKSFSEDVIQEFHNPKNWGRMEDHHGKGVFSGGCGDTMEFYIQVQEDRIVRSSFWTDGCGPTVACGSRLTTMVKALPIDDARSLTPDDLADSLGGLPKENYHCSELSMEALKRAIEDATKAK